jgi:hypothetical protein
MKRAIKYWNQYSNDGAKFSTCSTKYEILPGLYPDSAGYAELETIAESLGFTELLSVDVDSARDRIEVTESLLLVDQYVEKSDGHLFRPEMQKHQIYLGFIALVESELFPALKSINNKVPKRIKTEIYDYLGSSDLSKLGFEELGHHSQDDKPLLVMTGWHYYHVLPLLGYNLDSLRKTLGVTENNEYFYDSVTLCDGCFEYDDNDSGYPSNFRHTENGSFGINCGCFKTYCIENVMEYANEASKAIELDVAEELEKQGQLKHVERFIGGMVDGRGGRYNGELTREGDPKTVLVELLKKHPKKQYVFSHDESGQFQSYFSVWEVKKSKKNKKIA